MSQTQSSCIQLLQCCVVVVVFFVIYPTVSVLYVCQLLAPLHHQCYKQWRIKRGRSGKCSPYTEPGLWQPLLTALSMRRRMTCLGGRSGFSLGSSVDRLWTDPEQLLKPGSDVANQYQQQRKQLSVIVRYSMETHTTVKTNKDTNNNNMKH